MIGESLPKWQTRVVRIVDEIIRTGDVVWGRRYAGFLARQLARIDDAVGRAPVRMPNKKTAKREATRAIVQQVAAANPAWTVREIAEASGVAPTTVSRYTKELHT